MRTIALLTQKGGSGKSTLSASIAVEMQARGETVFLVDMDPQGSLATWARGRSDRRLAGAAVGSERLGDVLATLRDRGVTLAIIDTSGELPRKIATVPTQQGARTGAVDPSTGAVYSPTARFSAPVMPGARGQMVPGSVELLVIR